MNPPLCSAVRMGPSTTAAPRRSPRVSSRCPSATRAACPSGIRSPASRNSRSAARARRPAHTGDPAAAGPGRPAVPAGRCDRPAPATAHAPLPLPPAASAHAPAERRLGRVGRDRQGRGRPARRGPETVALRVLGVRTPRPSGVTKTDRRQRDLLVQPGGGGQQRHVVRQSLADPIDEAQSLPPAATLEHQKHDPQMPAPPERPIRLRAARPEIGPADRDLDLGHRRVRTPGRPQDVRRVEVQHRRRAEQQLIQRGVVVRAGRSGIPVTYRVDDPAQSLGLERQHPVDRLRGAPLPIGVDQRPVGRQIRVNQKSVWRVRANGTAEAASRATTGNARTLW